MNQEHVAQTTLRATSLGVMFLVAALVAWLTRQIPLEATQLFPGDLPENPYLVPSHGFLLYVLLPLCVLSNIVLWWGPGLCVALAFFRPRRWSQAAVMGFGLAYLVQFLVLTTVRQFGGGLLDPSHHRLLATAVLAGCWGLLALRQRREGSSTTWPVGSFLVSSAALAILAVVSVVAFLPVLLWQDPNADGWEALYSGVSMQNHAIPRFPMDPGILGMGVGAQGTAPVITWFTSWFGTIDMAARSNWILALVGLFAGLIELIEMRSPRRLGILGTSAVAAALLVYSISMLYSAGYDSFVGDASSPAGMDTLFAVLALGALGMLFSQRWGLCVLFTLLAFLMRPTILPIMLLATLGAWLSSREERRALLLACCTSVALCLLAWFLHDLWSTSTLGSGSDGPRSTSLLSRFRYLTFTDFGRLLHVIVPCGILPAGALLLFRRGDAVARSVAVVSLGYLAITYIPAFVALHHFVPVMLLPVVVFWRLVLGASPRTTKAWGMAALLGCCLAGTWALPREGTVVRDFTVAGEAILLDAPSDDFDATWRCAPVLSQAIQTGQADDDHVRQALGISLLHRATRGPAGSRDEKTQTIIQPKESTIPEGWIRVQENEHWVRLERPDRPLDIKLPYRSYMSPCLHIPREVLFRHLGVNAERYDVDLRNLLGR